MSATHDHNLLDTDPYFSIEPSDRTVICENSDKTYLMQYDHNSERFTFTIDRYIEGHDMLQCNEVRIHYSNASSTSKKAESNAKKLGIYTVTDLQVDPSDPERLVFSWIISQKATMIVGLLLFTVEFSCIEENKTVYRWNSGINKSISVVEGVYNGDAIIDNNPELFDELNLNLTNHINICNGKIKQTLDEFESEMYDHIEKTLNSIDFATTEEVENILS